MKVDVLLGLQWGDEGKGKIVDVLTPRYDIITRFQGGPNAGHTLEFNNIKHILHNIPSGIFRDDKLNIIANGVVLDPIVFRREIESLEAMDIDLTRNLWISKKAHLILPTHQTHPVRLTHSDDTHHTYSHLHLKLVLSFQKTFPKVELFFVS